MVDDKMRVALHHGERLVSQHVGDLEERCALRREHRGRGMTQVMEAKVADSRRFECDIPVRVEMLVSRVESSCGLPVLGSRTTVGEGNKYSLRAEF